MQPVRLRVAIVQMKPSKGNIERNLAIAREAFSQLATDPPDLVVFPEAAMTGYFLEGAVYDLAQTARGFRGRSCGGVAGVPEAAVDLVAGFYENDGGTYYNSALYLHVERPASGSCTCTAKCFCRRTASSTKSASYRAAAISARSRRVSGAWRC